MEGVQHKFKLEYKGSDSISKKDAQRLITLASRELAEVFTIDVNNQLVLLIFKSSEIFLGREAIAVRKFTDDSLVFTEKFCDLLQQRDDVPGALNELINLDDPDLANYQKKIHKIFNKLLPNDLKIIEIPSLQSSQNNEPEPPPASRRQLGVAIPIPRPLPQAVDEADTQEQLHPDVQDMHI